MERENDHSIDRMGDRVSALKKITIDIHGEVDSQHRLLDESAMTSSELAKAYASRRAHLRRWLRRRVDRGTFGKSSGSLSSSSSRSAGYFCNILLARVHALCVPTASADFLSLVVCGDLRTPESVARRDDRRGRCGGYRSRACETRVERCERDVAHGARPHRRTSRRSSPRARRASHDAAPVVSSVRHGWIRAQCDGDRFGRPERWCRRRRS